MECGELDFDKYLKDTIKQEGHLSPLYIKFYWQSMLQAVGALHKEGQGGLCIKKVRGGGLCIKKVSGGSA